VTTESFAARPETAAEEERRTSYLELFFDLVFVFAITQVTSLFIDDPTAGGYARAALVLALVWWAWGAYAWLTNAIDIDSLGVRLLYLVAMGGSFALALAVPKAYDEQGAWFVIPYFAVRVLHIALYVWGLRGDPEHQAAIKKLAPWFLVAPGIVLVGGFVGDPARTWLWAAALVIDVGGALTMGPGTGFRVSPAHFAERYALFVIIALGESIVAIGAGAADLDRDTTFAIAVTVAFAGAAVLWWAYFDFAALGMQRSLAATPEDRRGPAARDVFSIFHYPIVLGIILFAVAAKKTLEHPSDPLSTAGRAALGIGAAVFLLGFVLGRYRMLRRVAWERLAGGAAAAAAVLLLDGLDAMWLLAVVTGVLATATAVESARLHDFRARLRAAAH
jgi:low temperature requirement protein LtrA